MPSRNALTALTAALLAIPLSACSSSTPATQPATPVPAPMATLPLPALSVVPSFNLGPPICITGRQVVIDGVDGTVAGANQVLAETGKDVPAERKLRLQIQVLGDRTKVAAAGGSPDELLSMRRALRDLVGACTELP